jgi:hypothetical protein
LPAHPQPPSVAPGGPTAPSPESSATSTT